LIFIHRNAVLPKFLTWSKPGGYHVFRLKFPGTSPVYCHEKCSVPLLLQVIDHKTCWQSPTSQCYELIIAFKNDFVYA